MVDQHIVVQILIIDINYWCNHALNGRIWSWDFDEFNENFSYLTNSLSYVKFVFVDVFIKCTSTKYLINYCSCCGLEKSKQVKAC